jgi:hypothetical protein
MPCALYGHSTKTLERLRHKKIRRNLSPPDDASKVRLPLSRPREARGLADAEADGYAIPIGPPVQGQRHKGGTRSHVVEVVELAGIVQPRHKDKVHLALDPPRRRGPGWA